MAYNASLYNPYQPSYGQSAAYMAQPVNGLVSVTGIDGAKAYQLPPNSSMPLFDANDDILYLKTTDGAGFPTIRTFSFAPVEEHPEATAEYVTREDFDALLARVDELSKPTRSRKAASDAQ